MNVQNPRGCQSLVAIDPGRHMGFAVFVYCGPPIPGLTGAPFGWVMSACGLINSTAVDINQQARDTCVEARSTILRSLWERGIRPDEQPIAVCELMEWRPDDAKSNPQDLIRVATIGATVAGMLSSDLRFVTPQDWKGQVPKDIMGRRIRGLMNSAELKPYAVGTQGRATSLHHNVLDAIGIGLYATGRMARGGV